MAGSQLKNLKATLKAHGLTGQTNIKKNKKNTKRQAKDYDREEKAQTLNKIREQFNPFEIKSTKGKQFKADPKNGRMAVGKPGISKQIGEDQRLKAYEVKKQLKNRRGGIQDRRFGERDKNLTEEEKMLERFTRERQSQSKKKSNLFNLDDDQDNEFGNNNIDMYGNNLTHLGNTITDADMEEDSQYFAEQEGNKRSLYDEDSLGYDQESNGPARKKTKAEVMQEVIAKSKFHKQERQKAQRKLEDEIEDVDEEFDDVMAELFTSNKNKKKEPIIEPKAENDIEYDMNVKKLLLEKRAVPADRTKTEEELQKEADEKKKKLEQQRMDRMNGMLVDEEGEERGVEDLDNGFWESEEENEEEDIADSDDDIKFGEDEAEADNDNEGKVNNRFLNKKVSCPSEHTELLNILKKSPLSDHPKLVRKIIRDYQPKLDEGNKERIAKFTAVLLRHILFLAGEDYSKDVGEFKQVQKSLISILKTLAEKYNKALSDECRMIIKEVQDKFKKGNFSELSNSDLMFFILVGVIFSTSDHYHLVATSCVILMAEFLEQLKFNTLSKIGFGAVIVNILLQYQRMSKRYIPEMVGFYEKALATFVGIDKTSIIRIDTEDLIFNSEIGFAENDSNIIQLHNIFDEKSNESLSFQKTILLNILSSLDTCISNIWKDLDAFPEITIHIKPLLTQYSSQFKSLNKIKAISDKIIRLEKFHEHIPLTLQDHKPVSIPSNTPKYEENFNPDKKSYDPDRTRNEIGKIKAQIKKERKFTMKEIRKDARFEARQTIDEKKKANQEYHAKMAHIYNTISTEEGAEKNKYEREKRLRTGKK
ncbi:nucleolar complex protein 14 [Monosporozyma unispora]|nr:nucleolar complex protein 14 [Kazachstania unispora]